MRVLLDTHLLIWAATDSPRLPRAAAARMADANTQPMFSTISIAEVSIKRAQNRPDFTVDPYDLRQLLLDNGYTELPLLGDHACRLLVLPAIHKDPFDRMLIAQAIGEGVSFVTADTKLAGYGGHVIVV